MGRTWRIPNSGVQVDVGPSLERHPMKSAAHWRFPVVEQLATQFGGAFASDARPLSAHELEIARPLFQESLEYSAVRVVRAHFANAPTTLGNHIRIGFDSRFDDATVLHELTHIWQYQTRGTGYISNSLCAQSLHGPGANHRFGGGMDSHTQPHIMPFFRVEF